jgi:hypothetical protein
MPQSSLRTRHAACVQERGYAVGPLVPYER